MKHRNRMEAITVLILAAVGLIITALAVAWFISTYRTTRRVTEPITQGMADAAADIKDSSITAMDGEEQYGQDVINFFKKHLDDYTGTYKSPYAIVINNGSSTQTYYTRDDVTKLSDTTDAAHYVKRNSVYICDVTVNANGVITQVKFTIK